MANVLSPGSSERRFKWRDERFCGKETNVEEKEGVMLKLIAAVIAVLAMGAAATAAFADCGAAHSAPPQVQTPPTQTPPTNGSS